MKKKVLSILLALSLAVGSTSFSSQAAVLESPMGFVTVTGDENGSVAMWTPAARGAYLAGGMSSIARASVATVNISGSTEAHYTCDELELWLFLEQSESYATGYSTYRYFKYKVQDEYTLGKEISNIKVEPGYYYRTYAVHRVTNNGVTETTDSITDPIKY